MTSLSTLWHALGSDQVLTTIRLVNSALIAANLFVTMSFLGFTFRHNRWRIWGLVALVDLQLLSAFGTVDRLVHHTNSNPEITYAITVAMVAALGCLFMYRRNIHSLFVATVTAAPSKESTMTDQPTPQVPENGVTGNPDADPADPNSDPNTDPNTDGEVLYDPDADLDPSVDTGEDQHGQEDITPEDEKLAEEHPAPEGDE